MGPVNNIEFMTCFFFLLISIFFNALVFGDIYTVWEKLTRDDQENQEFLDTNKDVMDILGIDSQYQKEIREFFYFTEATRNA